MTIGSLARAGLPTALELRRIDADLEHRKRTRWREQLHLRKRARRRGIGAITDILLPNCVMADKLNGRRCKCDESAHDIYRGRHVRVRAASDPWSLIR